MNKITPDSTQTGYHDNSGILTSEIGELGWMSSDPLEKPMQNALVKYDKTKKLEEELINEFNTLYAKDVIDFQKAVQASGFTIFSNYKKVGLK